MRNIPNNLYQINAANKNVANADLYVMKFWILWKMHLEITIPSTIVDKPSSVSTMSAAARAASVDPGNTNT